VKKRRSSAEKAAARAVREGGGRGAAALTGAVLLVPAVSQACGMVLAGAAHGLLAPSACMVAFDASPHRNGGSPW
jgi:hypothetical protein